MKESLCLASFVFVLAGCCHCTPQVKQDKQEEKSLADRKTLIHGKR
ncbi:hypothetical protein [Helicobacter bizzozeronii]|uniref:Lipoprotein n=1 Tax=Helicobacter bizzozeronii (strain CIII-1) TaxID=1002804 RepID=F8KRP9_HELBC|nr:hypothetical protein [Helicobacter bizzozeronii]CCB79436.1 hypothetical protein HBZC1_04500 [Helicobacter bizzozeronii CIII-1]CCF79994.1 hypothetical protein HBZS_104420 [Helicobacter bizzozeronii CCUG 35545]